MKVTTKLGLKKPEQTDNYNVEDFNFNADVIDSMIDVVMDGKTQIPQSQNEVVIDLSTIMKVFGDGIYLAQVSVSGVSAGVVSSQLDYLNKTLTLRRNGISVTVLVDIDYRVIRIAV